jgi:hypothetical protein
LYSLLRCRYPGIPSKKLANKIVDPNLISDLIVDYQIVDIGKEK